MNRPASRELAETLSVANMMVRISLPCGTQSVLSS
jgi:hypothetical protein